MEYIEYKNEKCEVIEIVGRNARIKTSEGVKIILLPKEHKTEKPNYANMTKAELIERAEVEGIEVNAKMKKDEIIEALEK